MRYSFLGDFKGKDLILNDMGEQENNGTIIASADVQISDVWIPLEAGDPIELEDIWGNKCPPQCALDLDRNSVIVFCYISGCDKKLKKKLV